MKALFFDGLLTHLIDNYQIPDPGEDEALIKILLAGICGTDMEIMKGYRQFKGVLGHEFVGVVERVNGGYHGLVGKRVVGEITLGCGTCDYCSKGVEKHCSARTVLGISEKDGVFAEYVTLPLKNLWEVPDRLADEEAVFAEPVAAAFEVLEQVHVKPTDKVAVLGDGKLGLLVAMVLTQSGLNTVLLGRHETKLAIAGRQGIRTKLAEEVQRKRAYEMVVEATGTTQGMESALDLTKPGGTIVLKSTVAPPHGEQSRGRTTVPAGQSETQLSRVVIDEIMVVGSRCGPFPPALEALAGGRIDVKPLISAIYPFPEASQAFEKAREKETVKVLLDFRGPR